MSTRSWNSGVTLLGPLQNFLQSKNNSGRLRLIWILWIHLMYRGGRQEAAESERRKTGKDFCILSGRKYSDVPQQQQWTADCRSSDWTQLCFLPVIDFFFQLKLSNLHPAPWVIWLLPKPHPSFSHCSNNLKPRADFTAVTLENLFVEF